MLTLNTFKYLWKESFLTYLCSVISLNHSCFFKKYYINLIKKTRDKKESLEEFYQMIYGLLICIIKLFSFKSSIIFF